jgi:hypothetical protein
MRYVSESSRTRAAGSVSEPVNQVFLSEREVRLDVLLIRGVRPAGELLAGNVVSRR